MHSLHTRCLSELLVASRSLNLQLEVSVSSLRTMCSLLQAPYAALLIYFESLILWLDMFALYFWCYDSLLVSKWLCCSRWSWSQWSRWVVHCLSHIRLANITRRCVNSLIMIVFGRSKSLEILNGWWMHRASTFQSWMSYHVIKWILGYSWNRWLMW